MPNVRITCPTCDSELEIGSEHLGEEVECGSCLQPFTAKGSAAKTKPYKMRRRERDDDRDDDEDDDRPRRRRRRRDDDDFEYDPDRYDRDIPPRSRVAYILLAFFIGGFGVHNFYAGRTSAAIGQVLLAMFNVMMIVFAACTGGATLILAALGLFTKFIWIITEMIVVTEDGEGRPMV
jgi:TM2 domain-containing membrane protein YozV